MSLLLIEDPVPGREPLRSGPGRRWETHGSVGGVVESQEWSKLSLGPGTGRTNGPDTTRPFTKPIQFLDTGLSLKTIVKSTTQRQERDTPLSVGDPRRCGVPPTNVLTFFYPQPSVGPDSSLG